MSDVIRVEKIDEVHMKVHAESHAIQELSIFFTFQSPNYKFDPAFKAKKWDGKIRLLDKRGNKLYIGLLEHVKKFCDLFDYQLEIDPELLRTHSVKPEETLKFAQEYVNPHREGEPATFRDYQLLGLHLSIKNRRALLISPTGSGKSLMLYGILKYLETTNTRKVLLVVPTTALVEQMYDDFREYCNNDDRFMMKCHRIYSGMDKTANKDIYISTWQSIYDLPKAYFERFDAVLVDEVHEAEAKSIKGIMHKCVNAKYRVGCTGTLKDAKTHQLTLEGLFGKAHQIETTKNLMDRGILAKLEINMLALSYEVEKVKNFWTDQSEGKTSAKRYQKELEWLCQNKKRNLFIKNLALDMKGNTLILFQYVDKHGKILRDYIERDAKAGRKVFFVYGGTPTEQRNELRAIVEEETDAIIIASYGTFSRGINIKNIHNIIFASPYKSKVKVLQSIGRGLRKSATKTFMTLIDLFDDLRYNGKENYTVNHAIERMSIYDREGFEYDIHKVEL